MAHHAIHLDAAPLATLVGFRGVEEVSRLFRFEAFVRTPPMTSIDVESALWSAATLELAHAGAPDGLQTWHGIVKAVRLIEARSALEGRLWQVTIVPTAYRKLALSRHSRVFTELDLKGLLEDLLQRCGLAVGTDVRLELDRSYPSEEQVTQYRESDLDFLSRWLEHHGVRFWFEHADGKDLLVISDKAGDPSLRGEPVIYAGGGGEGDATGRESFLSFRGARRTRPAAVEVDDHDYTNPTLVTPERKTVSRDGLGRVRIYGERAVTPEHLGPTADRRAALWSGGSAAFEGAGDVGGLRAGHAFSVESHPREAMNAEYLAVRVEHLLQTSVLSPQLARSLGLSLPGEHLYFARVQAVPAGTAYHPPLRAARPRATGVERAVIDGPAGHHYAQIDSDGRYRVRFDFDEGDGAAGKASVAVRMMQMHGGNPESAHFPLRKKTQVLVAFEGGDPDRPTIVGAVPDAHTPSAVTRSNGTLNVVHTGSDTRIEIEDQKGSQFIVLSTPPKTTRWHMGAPHDSKMQGSLTHHFVETTDGDCLFQFGGDQDVNVGAKLWEIVEGQVLELYDTSLESTITGPQKTHVTGPVIELYGATQATDVTGLVKETYDSVQITAVSGLRDEAYVGSQQSGVKGFVIELYDGTQDKTVTGGVTETYDGPLVQSAGGAVTQTFAAPVKLDYGPTVLVQPSVSWNVAGSITVTTPMWLEIISVRGVSAAMLDAVATSETKINGISLNMNVVKRENHGATGEFNAFKAEVVGPNILFAGFHLKGHGVKVGESAATHTTCGGFTKLNP